MTAWRPIAAQDLPADLDISGPLVVVDTDSYYGMDQAGPTAVAMSSTAETAKNSASPSPTPPRIFGGC